jgi:RNA polymerase sigma factor for flagellar operon FliA
MSLAIDLVAEESELWRRYRQGGEPVVRDQLFRLHMAWAAAVGRNVYRRVGVFSLDSSDFVQNAELGMLEAITRYEPERGVDFRSFARARVRGAVFNGLRSMMRERGISNDDQRHAERLSHLRGGEGDAFDTVVDAVIALGMGFLLDHAANEAFADTSTYVQRDQTHLRLKAAVSRLPERMQELVTAHYFDFVPFSDIADDMGISRSRVSQLHREALQRLRDVMRDCR